MKNAPGQHKATPRQIIITAIVVNILLALTNHKVYAEPDVTALRTGIACCAGLPLQAESPLFHESGQ